MLTKQNSMTDLIEGVYNHGPDILKWCITDGDISLYADRVVQEHLHYPIPPASINENWMIPDKYKNFNVEEFCINQCQTQVETDRVNAEIKLYQQHNMIPVLQCMKYIVDTLRENNIVWGVGRGSSVASYCLFLLGVHKINSIQYNLPLNEFFR